MSDPRAHQKNVEALNLLDSATMNNLYSQVALADLATTANLPLSATEDPGVSTAALPYLPMRISIPNTHGDEMTLTLLINPENMNHGKSQSMNTSYTRKGYVTQYWGPNQDLITATGKSAAFMAVGEGLTNVATLKTLGFHNIMALIAAYRNNGYQIVDRIDLQSLFTRVIEVIPMVKLSYDGQEFLGHFNNFTMDDLAETPFIFNYNFEFVVSVLSLNDSEVRGHYLPLNYEKNLTPEQIAQRDQIEKKICQLKDVTVISYEISIENSLIASPAYVDVKLTNSKFNNVALWDKYIYEAAAQWGVDPNLIRGVMAQESGGNPNLTSKAGAGGLMQIMPKTARGLGLRVDETVDERFDPEKSINAAAKYLHQLLKVNDGNEQYALASYNGGYKHLQNVNYDISRMWPETQAYVPGVLSYKEQFTQKYDNPTDTGAVATNSPRGATVEGGTRAIVMKNIGVIPKDTEAYAPSVASDTKPNVAETNTKRLSVEEGLRKNQPPYIGGTFQKATGKVPGQENLPPDNVPPGVEE